MDALPIVCTLPETDLVDRKASLFESLKADAQEITEIANGFALRFPADDRVLADLFALIRLERKCCRFLTFELTVPHDGNPVWLRMTGPEGTRPFLRVMLSV